MQRWEFAALLVLAILAGCSDVQSRECGGLSACVQALRDKAQANDGSMGGMGLDADTLKRGILAHEGAVDALIPLLKDPDKRIADLAAFMLRDAPAIAPAYLPDIIEGLDRDLGWLAPALARIGTEEAAKEAVDRYLVSDSAPENQEAYALQLFGGQAIPFILERAACAPSCRDDTHYLLGAVLRRMGPERAAAGPGLIRMASDRKASPQVARGALSMIADLGTDGRALEQDLLREREEAPHLSPWIDQALIGIQSTQAGRIFAERLADGHDEVTLRDLAEVGVAGHDAGPAVLAILEQEPELRAAAATTLGYIGYAKATPALIEALDDRADVTLAWAAARALGRIGARDALAALDRTSAAHWYAPVRDAAAEAVTAIRSGASDTRDSPRSHFPSEFFAFQSINQGLPECQPDYDAKPESSSTKLYYATASRKLEQLKYSAQVLSYGAADEDQQRQAGADVIKVHPGNLVEHRESIEQTPHVALRVDDGWLVGGNRGEWGGELGFVGDDGHFQQILDVNLQDIHRLGDRVVATTGLAHMALNRGTVVALERRPDGRWQASSWRVLPGAPATSSETSNGLVIALVGGGAIQLAADGSMQMADCPP
ncbi:HEAT repeat domain-containing protein [Luteimonas sp. SJ-92]|uniref:HEAT repeat domain-containing protein n=1 Tax=Luteimonas salinisoli TaxID=2752307 RepID=A0A853JEE9_9GAMM|nr:HEAT repeat domain-containing protein [Luteimonas salinisoli]NZA27703.1 HEAT repeat domain-containing protein [Luteimonas salinisoli]